MLKFGHSKYNFLFKSFSLFLALVFTVAVFSISAVAGEYTESNRSNYHLANWYGLDELPYGDDTGVVYLKTNKEKWYDLTICFDKCTPLSQFVGDLGSVSQNTGIENSILQNFVYSHIWGLQTGATKNGNSFYLSCITDSPILYTYGNTGEDWKTLPWTYISQVVYTTQTMFASSGGSGTVDSSDSNVRRYKTVYVYLDVDLGQYGFSVQSDHRYYCYSNKLMTNSLSSNYVKDGIELHAITLNVPHDSQYKGTDTYNTAKTDAPYAYSCYPSSACLRDWKRWEEENKQYQQVFMLLTNLDYELGQTLEQLQFISEDTYKIRELLENIATGGKEYPSGGTLNDSSMSDQVDSIMGDISTDTSSANFIQTLSASFIVIRGLWDKIIGIFGLYGLIGLLLFLAFTAYLLGRALKNRSD